jgi:hypothetical protein
MKYIMHKFPKLKSLNSFICSNEVRVQHLNITLNTALKFIGFVQNIDDGRTYIHLDRSLESRLLKSIERRIEYVNINYYTGSFNDFIALEGENGENNITVLKVAKPAIYNHAIEGIGLNYAWPSRELPH